MVSKTHCVFHPIEDPGGEDYQVVRDDDLVEDTDQDAMTTAKGKTSLENS